ncbi:CRAL-TRIO domain-containing protein [Fennellomyces sp. T-0311]|nr:CRAL-TRIO domain-containing protein [Fennellomyces sp. T-0311]
MLKILQERAVLLNSQYSQHEDDIRRLTERLNRDVELLGFSPDDLDDAKAYINDDVTIFRYLREGNFDETTAHERLLDTIRWRQEYGVSRMTYESVASEFFDCGGFAFFHKQDKLGRPVAVVRMRYFPQFQDKSKSLTELMRPYACLVMEMVRKLMFDITWDNRTNGEPCALVSQMAVIIDIGKAPFIPIDAQLIKTMMELMDRRFPGFIGSIYVMNFGWMYQGLWQMVKYILSDEARSRISFPAAQEVLEIVPDENLLEELGGADPYVWTLESDVALHKYGAGVYKEEDQIVSVVDENDVEERVPSTIQEPQPVFTRLSRSTSVSSDIFFDANDTFDTASTRSAYVTPGSMTPLTVAAPPELPRSLWLPLPTNQQFYNSNSVYYWTGLHMGAAFLTSFVGGRSNQRQPSFLQTNATTNDDSLSFGINGFALMDRLMLLQREQEQDEKTYMLLEEDEEIIEFERKHTPHFPHLLPPDVPQSAYALAPVRMQIQRIEHRIIRLTRRIFHLSFAYKGAIYWVILYVFLRGPVEHVLRRSLASLFTAPQKLSYTTVGITAAVAAAIGSSVTASVSRPRRRST